MVYNVCMCQMVQTVFGLALLQLIFYIYMYRYMFR